MIILVMWLCTVKFVGINLKWREYIHGYSANWLIRVHSRV